MKVKSSLRSLKARHVALLDNAIDADDPENSQDDQRRSGHTERCAMLAHPALDQGPALVLMDRDQLPGLEAAQVDGATKWQRMIHVVVPHLMPLVSFVTLMLLMDNFRVFEPIVSFSAEAHATSLSWIIYNDLRESGNPLYGSAGATSMMTIIGVVILLTPVLIRTWRDFNRKRN